jgi:prepilin-type N-terminal cleavage/methylation domain-containing protein
MRTSTRNPSAGFTLIELLVVISIIAVLAGLIIGMAAATGPAKVRAKVGVQLQQIKAAIEAYHKTYGFYPPDNPTDVKRPPLYYELTGIDPGPAVSAQLGIKGIANLDKNEKGEVKNFLANLKPYNRLKPLDSGYVPVAPGATPEVYFLQVGYRGPEDTVMPWRGDFNPWHYQSTKPEHNTETFDLWAVVVVSGKTNVISIW